MTCQLGLPAKHPPLAVSDVTMRATTVSASAGQIRRCRAAGHNAQLIARIAARGPRTTAKWLSSTCAGTPSIVDMAPAHAHAVVPTRDAADSGMAS